MNCPDTRSVTMGLTDQKTMELLTTAGQAAKDKRMQNKLAAQKMMHSKGGFAVGQKEKAEEEEEEKAEAEAEEEEKAEAEEEAEEEEKEEEKEEENSGEGNTEEGSGNEAGSK
ncbi:hypothetical protein B7494_g5430 [Chlorociboria aeruginascens]|nr:hypothetical protein B7494_g5430 [Chlorociboria aeruginascens]